MSNEKEIEELDQFRKQTHEEGRMGRGVGADLAVRWNQSGRCSEGGERTMDVEDLWPGHDNTMYNCQEFCNPGETKAELEKKRDQIKKNQECLDKAGYLPGLGRHMQEKRKADYQMVCKTTQDRRPLGIRIKQSLKAPSEYRAQTAAWEDQKGQKDTNNMEGGEQHGAQASARTEMRQRAESETHVMLLQRQKR